MTTGAGASAVSVASTVAVSEAGVSATAGASGSWPVSAPRSERDFLPAMLCAHLVLAVHRRDVEQFGVLAAVRMLGAVVEVQGAHLVAAERTTRDHALHGLFQHALGEAALKHLARRHFLQAAGIAGVLVIKLVLQLAAGEAHLVGVDDDNIVAAIDVRGEARLMLAAQDVGDDRRDAADHQILGINQMPLLFHLGRFDRLGGLHQRLHGLDLFSKMREAPPKAAPSGGLMRTRSKKVKQKRGFANG